MKAETSKQIPQKLATRLELVCSLTTYIFAGICNAGALIGPIIGFVAGGRLFLDQFVDFDRGVK